jgi:AMIN domain
MLKQAILRIHRPLVTILFASSAVFSGAQSAPPQSAATPARSGADSAGSPPRKGATGEAVAANHSTAEVSRIRTWNADTYTRIVIDVGAPVKYQASRIDAPDRIYFDLHGAKVSSGLSRKSIDLPSGGFLKAIRIAQNQSDIVRVVLEVNRVKDYSVFLLPDPYRLVVEVHGPVGAPAADQQEGGRNGAPSSLASVAPSAAAAERPAPAWQGSQLNRLPRRAERYYELVWGISELRVEVAESGEMIRFNCRVLDPEKAARLNDKKAEPKLFDSQAGVQLSVPELEKVGKLRQSSTPMTGMTYWMAFANPTLAVKRGHRVDVVIGSFRASNLVVE